MPRQHERSEFRVQIELHFASGKHEAYISDISLRGCYIDTRVNIQPGDAVRFDVIHPNGGRLGFTGEVTHQTFGVGFGLKFTDLGEEQELYLKRILRQ